MSDDVNIKIQTILEADEAASVSKIKGQLPKIEGALKSRPIKVPVEADVDGTARSVQESVKRATSSLKAGGKTVIPINAAFDFKITDSNKVKAEVERLVGELTKNKGSLVDFKIDTSGLKDAKKVLLTYQNEAKETVKTVLKLKKVGETSLPDGSKKDNFAWLVDSSSYAKSFKQLERAQQKLETIAKRSEKLKAEISKNPMIKEQFDFSKVEKAINDGNIKAAASALGELNHQYDLLKISSKKDLAANAIENLPRQISDAATQLKLLQDKLNIIQSKGGVVPQEQIDRVAALSKELAQLSSSTMGTGEVARFNEISVEINNISNAAKEMNSALKAKDAVVAADTLRERYVKLLQVLDNLKVKWSAFTKDPKLLGQFDEIRGSIASALDTGDLSTKGWSNLNAQVGKFSATVEGAGKNMKTFLGRVGDNFKKFTSWFLIGGVTATIARSIKEVISSVVELNKAFVDIQMVTNGTNAETDKLMKSYSSLAKRIGATTTEVASAASDWLRQGFSTKDTETLIENSMVLSKVGAIDAAAATNYLTTAMKGYGLAVEDTLSVVDKLSAVDLVSATSAGGLAEGMSEVANNARLAGVEMDKLLGYLAVIGETTGAAPSSVGTTLNAIFSRMGNVKLSRLKDYQNETGEDLSNVETVLRGEGIALRDSANSFRNFGDVLDETASKWDSFSDVSKRAIASAFGGIRHIEETLVLMENYGKATEYAAVASESSGTAMEKMGAYQEGIEARQKRMTAASQEFSNAILNSDLIKFTYDAGTGILGFLTKVTETLGALPVLASTAAAALSFKNLSLLRTTDKGAILPAWMISGANKRDQALTDSDALRKFVANIGSEFGGDRDLASTAYLSEASDAAKEYAKTMDLTRGAVSKFEKAQMASVQSTGKFGGALKGLGGISKSIAVSLGNMAIAMVAAFALSKAIEAISNAVRYAERLSESLRESKSKYSENESAVKNLNAQLENTQSLIDDLQSKGSLSPVEQEELDRLKETNDELERQLRIQNAITRVSNQSQYKAFQDVVDADRNDRKLNIDTGKYSDYDFNRGDIRRGGSDLLTRYYTSSESYYDWLLDEINSRKDAISELYSQAATASDEELIQINESIQAQQDKLSNLESKASDRAKWIQEQIDGIDYISTPANAAERAVNDGLDFYNEWLNEFDAVINGVSDAKAQFDSVWGDPTNATQVESLKQLASQGKLTSMVLESDFAAMQKAWEQIGWTSGDVVGYINAEFGTLNTAGAATTLETLGASLTAIADKAKLVQDAMSEQAENGSLSYETYQKLIGISGSFADALQLTASGWQINEEALWGYLEALGETEKQDALVEMAKLQEELNNTETSIATLQDMYGSADDSLYEHAAALQNQINKYAALIAEINGTTSAYKKWLAAKGTKNKDEMFNAGGEMYETIKEGNKSGKTGTDDFQSSVDFMLGENWGDNYSDSKSAYKAAQKKGQRYFGQKDERKGAINFAKDLAKNYGGATWDGKSLAIETGSTLEGMAEAMGMSEDAVKSLFDLLSTYEIDYDWAYEMTDAEIDRAKAIQKTTEAIEENERQLEAERDKDPSLMTEEQIAQSKATIAQLEQEAATLAETLETLNETPVSPTVEEAELSPLEQLKVTLDEVQTTITTLNTTGLTIPVSLTQDAEALQAMITALSTADGLSLDIQAGGTDAAKTAVEAIQTALAFIKDNPNVSSTVSASLTETGEAAITAIGNLMGWDQQTIDLLLNPTDNVTPKVTEITDAGGETTIDVDADTTEFDTEVDAITAMKREASITIKPVLGTISDKDVETYGYTKGEDGYVRGESGLILGAAEKPVEVPIEISDSSYDDLAAEMERQLGERELEVEPELRPNEPVWGNPDPNYDYSQDWDSTGTATGEVSDNTKEIADNTEAAAKSAKEFWEYYDSTKQPEAPESTPEVEVGGVTIEQDTIDTYIAASEKLIQSAQESGVEATALGDATTALATASDTLANTDPANTEAYATATEAVKTAILDSATAYESLKLKMESTVTVPVDANTTQASQEIDKLGNKTVTVTVKQKMSGYTYASGSKKTKPGVSLVDEEGPELIEHRSTGTFSLGSSDGPRLANLKAGDVVHTAQETKKILKRNPFASIGSAFKDGFNRGKAFIGRAFATGVSGVGDFSSLIASAARSSKKNSSSSKKSTKDGWKKYLEKLFDWIEIKLDRLQTITDKWAREVERAVGFVSKNKAIDSSIAAISTQITTLAEAYHAYMEQAATIASKTKLSSSIVSLIQNGGLDIASYSSDTQTKIKAYQEWWDKARGVTEQIEELVDQQKELANQKIDNIIDQYDRLASAVDNAVDKAQNNIDLKVAQGKEVVEGDYLPIVQAQQDKLVQLMQGRALVSAEFNKQVAEGTLVGGSEAWYEYIEQMNELDKAIIDTRIDLEELNDSIDNIVVTNLGFMLDGLKNTQSSVEQTLDLIMAQGRIPTESIYRQLISNGMQQIENLRKQNEELDKQKDGLETNSEKYQDILAAMRDNESAIGDIMSSQEGWNDAILDLRIDELQRMRDELDKNNQSYQRSLDLQQAIEDLEKAKSQRTVKVLQDGKFVYMRDEEDVASKQRALDQKMHEETLAKFDDAIDAIQDSKADSNVWESIGLSPESMVSLFPNTSIEDLIKAVLGNGTTGVDFGIGSPNTIPSIGDTNNTNTTAQVTFGEGSVIIQTNDPYEVIRILSTEMGAAFTQQLYR